MRLKFIPKPIDWGEVREEILKEMEEEERRNEPVVFQSTSETEATEINRRQMDAKEVGKMSTAEDSCWIMEEEIE